MFITAEKLTAVFLVRSVLTVRVSVTVPMFSDTTAICAAELLVGTFTHVWHGEKTKEKLTSHIKRQCE